MGACSSNPAAVVANNTTAPPLSSKQQPPNGSILNKKGGGQGGDTNSREVKFTNSTEQNLGKKIVCMSSYLCNSVYSPPTAH